MIQNKAHIMSVAGVLPTERQIISPKVQPPHAFNDPQHIALSESRYLWRLNTRKELTTLMALSVTNAARQAGISCSQINYVFLSQVWPENCLNDEAKTLAAKAELVCPIVPINSGTSGGLTALELASALLHNTSMNYIAVITGCNYSHWFQTNDPAQMLLSDGAACVILGRENGMEIAGCHTISTQDYGALKFTGSDEGISTDCVSYSQDAGAQIVSHYPKTIFQCCARLCQSHYLNFGDIAAFHIYDPTEWVKNKVMKTLSIGEEKVISVFPRYGSLGPAQNFFGLIEARSKGLSKGDWVISMGFGPSATATAILFRWQHIPFSIQHFNGYEYVDD